MNDRKHAMHRTLLFVTALAVLTGWGRTPVYAQANRDATIGLYLMESPRSPRCTSLERLDCSDEKIKLDGDLYTEYYAILCVFNGDASAGIAGLELGLDYDGGNNAGVDIDEWVSCGNLEFSTESWPGSGSGNRITWNKDGNCNTEEPGGAGKGVTAIAGFFRLTAYDPDRLQVTPHFSGHISVADCEAAETTLPNEAGGSLGFSDDGTVKGDLPCVERRLVDTTWGTIKSSYDHD